MANQIDKTKLPPQNTEAEQSLLGSLLLDKEAINRVADILSAEDFYVRAHQLIYEHMLKMYEKREPIDMLSLSNSLKNSKKLEYIGGASYLTKLVNTVPTAAHATNYATIIQRKKILRDMIDKANEIIGLGQKEDEDVEELLDLAEQKLFSVSQRSIQQNFQHVSTSLNEAFERLEHLHARDGRIRGVPTGFIDLDNILSGLQKSNLVILAARPSLGKTTLALDIVRSVAQESTVGVFSVEMSREEVTDRLIASEAGVSLWNLRTGKLRSDGDNNDFQKIARALDTLKKNKIFIDDSSSPTVLQMRAMARRLQAEHGLGLIVVDYLQLIRPSRNYDSSVQQITEISRNLKGLARELSVPVLAISQLSRAVETRGGDQKPRLSDLRDSGCVTGDTRIHNADTGEIYTIEQLYKEKISIPVWTIDEQLKLSKQKLVKSFPSGTKTIYELKLRSGRAIKASANHPFYMLNGWTRLDELSPKDNIALPRIVPSPSKSKKLNESMLILLAHMIGNGCYANRQPIHYTSKNPASLDIVFKTSQKAFDLSPRKVKQENCYHIYLSSKIHGHNPFTDWLRDLGIYGQRSHQKLIPSIIFELSDKQIELFLKHLWSTDGCLSYNRTSNNYIIYYASNSIRLATDVQQLLLRLGILSTIRESKEKEYKTIFNVHVQGKNSKLLFLNKVGAFGQKTKHLQSAKAFLNKIKSNPNNDVIPKEAWKLVKDAKNCHNMGWDDIASNLGVSYDGSAIQKNGISSSRMSRLNSFLKSPLLANLEKSDIYWDEVLSITKLGQEIVYDATVENTHNFLANDIFIHNSIEQDADVVMFIYREDKVKQDTEKKNVAEILISKHRNGPTGEVELYFDEQQVSFKNLAKNF